MYRDTSSVDCAPRELTHRANHSAELAAIKLVDYIKYSIDRKCTPVNIYIDPSKAFDTVYFDILLYKLHYYGIKDIALKF